MGSLFGGDSSGWHFQDEVGGRGYDYSTNRQVSRPSPNDPGFLDTVSDVKKQENISTPKKLSEYGSAFSRGLGDIVYRQEYERSLGRGTEVGHNVSENVQGIMLSLGR